MSRTADAARAALRSPRAGEDQAQSPSATRRRASLVALTALVVVLGFAGWSASRHATPQAATSPSPVAAGPSATATAGTAGIPLSGPPASWRLWSSAITRLALPTVAGAGPADPGVPAGFADTPTGALVAAANLLPQIWFATDGEAWQRLADHSVIWGDGARDDLLRRRTTAIADAPEVAQPLAIAGFRFIYFRGSEAMLRMWLRGRVNTLGMDVHLIWSDGDWKIAWDESAANIRVLGAEESFITWQALS